MAEHQDYPHTPGSLPGCPPCDIELARQAYVQASRGEMCPREAMEMLGDANKRLVELALLVDQQAREDGIPVRDALHRQKLADRSKRQIAEWVDPQHVGDWEGSIEDRRKAREAADDRARERMEDNVIALVADLDPEDWGLEAQQARETAASIRDHRADHANRKYWEAAELAREKNRLALEAIAERDLLRMKRDEAYQAGDYGWQATHDAQARDLDRKISELVEEQIAANNGAKRWDAEYQALTKANDEYDAERRRRERGLL